MTKKAKDLAKDLVQVQGNLFIRELLRERGYPPKRKQSELLTTVYRAIDDGEITHEILREWLDRVEGWGRQSVYLWRVPKNLARSGWWNPTDLKARVEAAGIRKWDADGSGVFRNKFTLTAVRLRDSVLTFEWHKAWDNLLRAEEYDETRDDLDPDDTIVLQGYRQSKRRATVRVQVRPKTGLVGVFVQVPISSPDHETVRDNALAMVYRVVPEEKFKIFDMSKVIRELDAGQLGSDDPSLWTKSARLGVEGAHIELVSTTTGTPYREFPFLRDAREILLGQKLEGRKAAFYFHAPGGIDTDRPVRVDFYGRERRFWLRAAMTEDQVWKFIERIEAAAR